jgi:cytochrome P450
MAVQEAQRLTPVAGQGVRRTVKRDTTLGGYKVPAGTIIWASFRPLFRSAELWDRPEEFVPVRISSTQACFDLESF